MQLLPYFVTFASSPTLLTEGGKRTLTFFYFARPLGFFLIKKNIKQVRVEGKGRNVSKSGNACAGITKKGGVCAGGGAGS